jgi:IS5 family transposase
LAQAARRQAGVAAGRQLAGGARGRCVTWPRPQAVTVDTTVQPKAITFPTDAKLLHAAIRGLNRLATRHGVRLRQFYFSRGQDRRNDGGTLRPCQTGSGDISSSYPAQSAGPDHPRYPRASQHGRKHSPSSLAGPCRSAATAAPARLQTLSFQAPEVEVHRLRHAAAPFEFPARQGAAR